MNETYIETTFAPGEQVIDLGVTQSGMTITVAAGTVIFGGQSHEFPQSTFTATNRAIATDICGYLAKEKTSGEVLLLVDELVRDGMDLPYDFSVGNYDPLTTLFACRVPPNSTSLDDVDVTIFRSKAREP